MQAILERIAYFAKARPCHTALVDEQVSLDYLQLQQQIERIAPSLQLKRIGLLLSNGCPWAVLDLAAHHRGAACTPMPSFFSDSQLRHLAADAGLEMIITDHPSRARMLAEVAVETEITVAGSTLSCIITTQTDGHSLPPGIARITYTSGTTGRPRGVCLTGEALEFISVSLSTAVGAAGMDRSLSLLPLSTLLANIAGIYAPLYSGSTACLPHPDACGINGSSGVHADRLVAALQRYRPTVTVLVPHLLKVLVEAVAQGEALPASLRYIAVGGAPVAPALLERARALGLPVYQGYGLSEAASVVSLNLPGHNRIGSVGRPLPHTGVRIAADGEIMVSDHLFGGYLGQPCSCSGERATGDLGHLDSDGYLHITGRKKTAFATAHGRNLAPEWVESELTGMPGIAQAALFGEGRSFNVAVLVASHAQAASKLGAIIATVNRTLPDYAQVRHWIIADEPFSVHNGLANGAGALNRQAIAASYADRIEPLYTGEPLRAVP